VDLPLAQISDLGPQQPFFGSEDYGVFARECVSSSRYDRARKRVRDKFLALHRVLYPEIQRRRWDLHPHWHAPNTVSTWSVGQVAQIWFMKLRYLRSHQDVKRLETLMGVPAPLAHAETQYTKHPMLDLRIDGQFLAVELLVTEWAWWDAQNFKSKLEQDEAERDRFVALLRGLGHDFIFGGWPDTRQPELLTTTADLADQNRLLSWLKGFEPGADWLRLGIWYRGPDDLRLATGRIAGEVMHRFEQLYPVYEFLLWTPRNNYRKRG
jgi:hypothetical protein